MFSRALLLVVLCVSCTQCFSLLGYAKQLRHEVLGEIEHQNRRQQDGPVQCPKYECVPHLSECEGGIGIHI